MVSKRLESILSNVPPATAKGENINVKIRNTLVDSDPLEQSRIVAAIPQILKDEIRTYIKQNKGENERTIILRSLKKMGFNVDEAWIVDKRTTR